MLRDFSYLCLLLILPACGSIRYPVAQEASLSTIEDVQAPAFRAKDQFGKTITLADELAKGLTVVLVFYRGYWCPSCRINLAELAAETKALRSRHVKVIGISVDTVKQSSTLAKRYHIPFPLLEDLNLSISGKYVGTDKGGYALPGVVVVRSDGRIAYRKIAKGNSKGRVTAPKLFSVLDEVATQGLARKGGFSPVERVQIRAGLVGGVARDERTSAAGGLSFELLAPTTRHVLLGLRVDALLGVRAMPLLSVAAKLRLPLASDIGEAYAQPTVGLDLSANETTLVWGGALGLQFAPVPSWAVFAEVRGLAQQGEKALTSGVGIAWLH